MVYTLGFLDAQELSEHFEKHCALGGEFPHLTTETEYQDAADLFLGSKLNSDMRECYRKRKDGTRDKIRYNKVTQEYGILSAANVIRSYYIANPLEHGWPTNYDYWQWDCGRLKG